METKHDNLFLFPLQTKKRKKLSLSELEQFF